MLARTADAPHIVAKTVRTTNHAKNVIQAMVSRIPIPTTTFGQCRAKPNITLVPFDPASGYLQFYERACKIELRGDFPRVSVKKSVLIMFKS